MKRTLGFFGVLAALLCGTPALAAIGTPVTIGTATAAGGAGATLATSITTNSCATGNLAVIATSVTSGTTANSVADSQGNTWTAGNSYTGTSNKLRFFYSILATTLSTGGDTITVTYSSSTGAKVQNATCVSNIQAIDLNPASGTTGTSTTPSITTTTLNHTSEVIFGITEVTLGSVDTYTEDTGNGWATVNSANIAGGGNNKQYLSYVIVSAATAKTYAPTLGTSRTWNQFYVSFYETGSSASDHNLSSMGVGH